MPAAAGAGPGSAAAPPPARLCLLALALPLALSGRGAAAEPSRTVYTNHWAVRVRGGPAEAARLAAAYGYISLGQVRGGGQVPGYRERGLRGRAERGVAPGAWWGVAELSGVPGAERRGGSRGTVGARGSCGGGGACTGRLRGGLGSCRGDPGTGEAPGAPAPGACGDSRELPGARTVSPGGGRLRGVPEPGSCRGSDAVAPGFGELPGVSGSDRRRESRGAAGSPGTEVVPGVPGRWAPPAPGSRRDGDDAAMLAERFGAGGRPRPRHPSRPPAQCRALAPRLLLGVPSPRSPPAGDCTSSSHPAFVDLTNFGLSGPRLSEIFGNTKNFCFQSRAAHGWLKGDFQHGSSFPSQFLHPLYKPRCGLVSLEFPPEFVAPALPGCSVLFWLGGTSGCLPAQGVSWIINYNLALYRNPAFKYN